MSNKRSPPLIIYISPLTTFSNCRHSQLSGQHCPLRRRLHHVPVRCGLHRDGWQPAVHSVSWSSSFDQTNPPKPYSHQPSLLFFHVISSCPTGKLAGPDHTTCVDACPQGSTENAATQQCVPCPAGTTTTSPGASVCVAVAELQVAAGPGATFNSVAEVCNAAESCDTCTLIAPARASSAWRPSSAQPLRARPKALPLPRPRV